MLNVFLHHYSILSTTFHVNSCNLIVKCDKIFFYQFSSCLFQLPPTSWYQIPVLTGQQPKSSSRQHLLQRVCVSVDSLFIGLNHFINSWLCKNSFRLPQLTSRGHLLPTPYKNRRLFFRHFIVLANAAAHCAMSAVSYGFTCHTCNVDPTI